MTNDESSAGDAAGVFEPDAIEPRQSRVSQMAATLLAAQHAAAEALLASQSAVAELLCSSNAAGAQNLIASQDAATRTLLASQAALAGILRSRNQEVATITALNTELEQCVRERTEELTLTNTRLEAATTAKSEFLASMSHELRTPLSSVIGFSGVLLSGAAGELNEEQARQLEMIQNSGRGLLGLVDKILDLAKIEAESVEVELREVDINALCGEALEGVRPQADAKRIELRFIPSAMECPGRGLPMTDHDKMTQIVLNLLSNAIKFTKEGSVELRVDCTGDAMMLVRVTDTGIGLEEDALEQVFKEFAQVHSDDEAGPRGTGLGLYISRELAILLGGDITVSSTLGSGSEFTLALPLRFADDLLH